LAQALGVEAMSLYNHVANKDEILAGMADLVFGEVELPAGHDWKRAMRQRSLSIRDAFLRHPWALGLMKSGNHLGEATLRHHDAVLGILRGAGFSLVGAGLACSVLDSHLYGFALREQHLPFDSTKPPDASAERLVKQMMAMAYPNLAEIAMAIAQLPDHSHTREFEFGLDLILDGLDRMRDAT
jgi:AcrR family transcriptional regulator